MITSFFVLAWKDAGGTFFPDGAQRSISCNHLNEGLCGLTLDGEIVPLPTTTKLISQAGTDFQKATVAIPSGTVTINPLAFQDAGFKSVNRIKDMTTLQITYVDATDYASKVGICNDCCTPQTCISVTPSVSGSPGATTTTIIWTENARATGYEYVNVENPDDCEDPIVSGTFTADATVSLTGLTTDTTYCFAVRALCGAGNFSTWEFVQFTTA